MFKPKSTPMTRQAASRIASAESKANGGKLPPASFGTRTDRVVQQREASGTRRPAQKH